MQAEPDSWRRRLAAAEAGDEARKAWKRSVELGIKPYEVHALEREAYRKMKDEYQDKP